MPSYTVRVYAYQLMATEVEVDAETETAAKTAAVDMVEEDFGSYDWNEDGTMDRDDVVADLAEIVAPEPVDTPTDLNEPALARRK